MMEARHFILEFTCKVFGDDEDMPTQTITQSIRFDNRVSSDSDRKLVADFERMLDRLKAASAEGNDATGACACFT